MQRYQEDHTDEMEIINLHRKCNKKARKVSGPKKVSASPKADEPKKVSVSPKPGPIDEPSEEEKKPKKSDGKTEPKLPEFVDSSDESEEEGPFQDDKEKKIPPLLGVKEEAQSFFDIQKESKNLAIEKKVEKAVFMVGPNKGFELSYVALCDFKYLKRVLKISDLEKKTKDLIKQVLAKT